MTRNLKISIALVGAFVVGAALLLLSPAGDDDDVPEIATADAEVVRASSHRLGEPASDGKVTLVEFLDFECEGCRAAFPLVEDLRERYAGRVTFVARYFPLSGHFNGERAARAVQAAAQQDQFEDMYEKMFTTQGEWGESQTPADDVFRGFAEELGLDLVQWDADYDDPATLERIRVDQADGRALGVTGTPSFFLNGERLEIQSADDLTNAIEAALAE